MNIKVVFKSNTLATFIDMEGVLNNVIAKSIVHVLEGKNVEA